MCVCGWVGVSVTRAVRDPVRGSTGSKDIDTFKVETYWLCSEVDIALNKLILVPTLTGEMSQTL